MKHQLNKKFIVEFEEKRKALFVAMAVNKTINDIDKKSKEVILKKNVFKVSKDNEIKGQRILKSNQDYLMSDKDFIKYCKLTHKERTKRGLKIYGNKETKREDYNTTSDYISFGKVKEAEDNFIDVCLKLIPSELSKGLKDIKKGYTHRKEFIDINLKLDTERVI